jgi:DNA-binding CsgD family transcriptional regulator
MIQPRTLQSHLQHVIDVIDSASQDLRPLEAKTEVLERLVGCLGADQAFFVYRNSGGDFSDWIGRGVDAKYLDWFWSRFYRLDPLNCEDPASLLPGARCRGNLVDLRDVMSHKGLVSSEYFNDFLRPQGIWHKTNAYLKCGTDLHGMVVLFRDRCSGGFTDCEKQKLSIITSYLARAMSDAAGRRQTPGLQASASEPTPEALDAARLRSAYGLTRREGQIAADICSGLRNLEIAELRFISEVTVKTHVQRIFEKTGARNRAGLVRKLLTDA